MNEFENWDINNKINYANASGKELCVQEERRKSWRAALEWVRGVGENAAGPEHNCYYEIIGAVDKELKE